MYYGYIQQLKYNLYSTLIIWQSLSPPLLDMYLLLVLMNESRASESNDKEKRVCTWRLKEIWIEEAAFTKLDSFWWQLRDIYISWYENILLFRTTEPTFSKLSPFPLNSVSESRSIGESFQVIATPHCQCVFPLIRFLFNRPSSVAIITLKSKFTKSNRL